MEKMGTYSSYAFEENQLFWLLLIIDERILTLSVRFSSDMFLKSDLHIIYLLAFIYVKYKMETEIRKFILLKIKNFY